MDEGAVAHVSGRSEQKNPQEIWETTAKQDIFADQNRVHPIPGEIK